MIQVLKYLIVCSTIRARSAACKNPTKAWPEGNGRIEVNNSARLGACSAGARAWPKRYSACTCPFHLRLPVSTALRGRLQHPNPDHLPETSTAFLGPPRQRAQRGRPPPAASALLRRRPGASSSPRARAAPPARAAPEASCLVSTPWKAYLSHSRVSTSPRGHFVECYVLVLVEQIVVLVAFLASLCACYRNIMSVLQCVYMLKRHKYLPLYCIRRCLFRRFL